MDLEIVSLPAFTCLGLEGEGPIGGDLGWVADLWVSFMKRSREIGHIECLGTWGLTSDPRIFPAPWGGPVGRYLASWQVPDGTEPFDDWKTWRIPAGTWLRVPARVDRIQETLERVRLAFRSNLEWEWSGNVNESYPPGFRDPAADDIHLMLSLAPR
jgi:hypothetical protein